MAKYLLTCSNISKKYILWVCKLIGMSHSYRPLAYQRHIDINDDYVKANYQVYVLIYNLQLTYSFLSSIYTIQIYYIQLKYLQFRWGNCTNQNIGRLNLPAKEILFLWRTAYTTFRTLVERGQTDSDFFFKSQSCN